MDMSKMLKDLQKMQSKMLKAQNDLKAQSFDAEAGGGMVKVAMNGKGVLTMVKICCKLRRQEERRRPAGKHFGHHRRHENPRFDVVFRQN